MRRVVLTLICCGLVLGGCELTVRGLFAAARSSVFLAWFLSQRLEGRLEFGPGEAAFVGPGFFPPAPAADQGSVIWASSTVAELRWPVLWPGDRQLVLRVRGFPHDSAEGQPLTVRLNGRVLARTALFGRWTVLSMLAPASAQRPGSNRLSFETPRLFPAELLSKSGTDPRWLGFQLDWLEIR
jgi:hypothetical protein